MTALKSCRGDFRVIFYLNVSYRYNIISPTKGDIVTERRRFLRFDTALNAICEFVHDKFRAPYKVKNISKEGALFVLDRELREGSELSLSMDVPGDNVPIFATCRVAWQKGAFGNGHYETGVRFTKLGASDKGRLLEYIYTQWLRFLDRK